MRIVFMGTPDFAAASLRKLLEEGFEVVGVFTQPDRPKGRGMELAFSPVKELALSAGLPVYQPEKMRDGTALAILEELRPDILAVVAYGRILPDELLALPRYGAVNVHGSLLPKYRGSAPIQWAVLNGDTVTGVSTMYLAHEMDTGDVIYTAETPIGEFETSGELFDRLKDMGAELLVKTLRDIEAGTAPRTPQDHSRASYVKMLDKSLCPIDWNRSPRMIVKQIYGLQPWPVATMELEGKTVQGLCRGLYRTPIRTRPRDDLSRRTGGASRSPAPAGRRCASPSCRRRARSGWPRETTCGATRSTSKHEKDCKSGGPARAGALREKRRLVRRGHRRRHTGKRSGSRDAALAARLCLGVLQNDRYLDYYIELYSRRDLEPRVRSILRLGAYQLLFLDKVPDHAAVSETVELCRDGKLDRAAGLVNAVLRRLASEKDKLPPIPGEGTAEYLSTRWSHPLWLAEKLIAERGYAFAEDFFRANNEPAPLCIQVNRLRVSPEDYIRALERAEIPYRAFPELPGCLELEGGKVTELPGFEEGLFSTCRTVPPARRGGRRRRNPGCASWTPAPPRAARALPPPSPREGTARSSPAISTKRSCGSSRAARSAWGSAASGPGPWTPAALTPRWRAPLTWCWRTCPARGWRHPQAAGDPPQGRKGAAGAAGDPGGDPGKSLPLCAARRGAALFHLHGAAGGKPGCRSRRFSAHPDFSAEDFSPAARCARRTAVTDSGPRSTGPTAFLPRN